MSWSIGGWAAKRVLGKRKLKAVLRNTQKQKNAQRESVLETSRRFLFGEGDARPEKEGSPPIRSGES